MSKLTIAGIRRENQFSPNHIGNDAAIFSLTVQHLRDLGCEVNEYIESDLIIHQFEETAIFNMVRNWTSIHKLQQMEDQGYTVINSGYGIENCTREKMTRLLMSNNISHPASLILPTDEDPTAALDQTRRLSRHPPGRCHLRQESGRSQNNPERIRHPRNQDCRSQRTSGWRPG